MRLLNYVHHHPFASTGFAIIAVLGIMVASLFIFLPQNAIDHFINKQVSGKLGREFAINGPFSIDWDWSTPHVHAEQITLSNLPGSADKNMVEIGSVDFTIKIWRLLTGRTIIPELTIEQPKIVLEKLDDHTKNWDLPALSRGKAVVDAALPNDRHDFPVIHALTINKGELIYRDANAKLNLDLKLDTASGTSTNSRDIIKLDGEGSLQEQKFTITAEGGSIRTLRDTNKDFPLSLDLHMGNTHVAVKGTFKDPVKMEGIDATLTLSGNNMADLFYLTAIPLPPTPPYTLTGQLGKKGDIWSYNQFKGKVGDSDLSGDVTYDVRDNRGFVKGDLVSHNMDMDDLGGFIGLAPSTGAGETSAPEQKVQKAEEKASSRLLPDVPLKLNRLRASDMDVTLKVDKLVSQTLPFNGMNVHFILDHGVLTLDPLQLSLADGTLDGKMELDGREDIPSAKINADFKKLHLNRFFTGTRFEDNTQANLGAHVELSGQGNTFAKLMGASNGRVVAIVSGGTISLLLIEASDLDLAEATPLFLGDDKTTNIRCGVGDFKVNDGQLKSQIFVLDTDDTTLEGKVDIDLKHESIDGELKADPKDASPLSLQSPITVSGPLKHPSIGIEAGETGARAGVAAVLGALLTPLASIIPYIEFGDGEDKNCGALISRAQADAKKAP